MNFSHFFIDRPIFAAVLSILVTLIGGFAYFTLPVAQYPEIAPPTIVIHASYPGASAEVVSDTVATPIEQEVNGVDNMLYMSSQSTGDGELSISVTFKLGTDLDTAQVLVQNRVAIAEPRLPEEVRRLGITVLKNSPDMLMVINLSSRDDSRDQLYISNYATLQVKDVLARLDGVGDVRVFGARDYSMRIWLDPDKTRTPGMPAGDVVPVLRPQNVQVASGVLNQPPMPNPGAFQLNVETLGRLIDTRQFANIIVRTDPDGRVTRVRDIGRVELGAQDYSANGYLDERPAVPLLIFQRPGSNALDTADRLQTVIKDLARDFPPGLRYDIVYNPTAFIPGISGQFFRQFPATIASATIISCFVSLTLSPALCALLFKPHKEQPASGSLLVRPARAFFRGFNRGFERLSAGYAALTMRFIRVAVLMLVVYAGLIALTGWQFSRAPTGFIPEQDQGYLITVLQLPPGASLARTDAVVRRAAKLILETEGVAHVVPFAGFDGATFTNAPNAGAIFVPMAPFPERARKGLSAERILTTLSQRLAVIEDAFIIIIPPPSVRGIGSAGGFKMMIQDKRGHGLPALEAAAQEIVTAANSTTGLARGFSLFNTRTPKIYARIHRVRAPIPDVPGDRGFGALQGYTRSSYVNDFNYLGRTYRVTAQADAPFRATVHDISNLKTRSSSGAIVPIGSVAEFRDITGPYRVPPYNLYPAAEVQGNTQPGYSTGYGLAAMERIAAERLPDGFGFEWTELAYQEHLAGNSGLFIFRASVVFVFLVLAAQYEMWSLPLAVILIVPMCLLPAVSCLLVRGMDVNILAQVGFVVLIGLAAKNAILIVEFAKQAEDSGEDRATASIQAGRTLLRPILNTSFAFILGVVPLAIATGAGAEMRQSLGTTVFFGMLGVTAFGLVFTPGFYVVVRSLFGGHRAPLTAPLPKPERAGLH